MADDADRARGGVSLDAVREAFGLAAHELQAFDPARPRFDAQRPLLVLPGQMAAAAARIAERYPEAHPARALIGGAARPCPARDLPRSAGAWLVAALAPHADLRAADGLRAIMARLCGPDGCPWDGAQTHESLRGALLEESYEAVEAIDRGDAGGLREELGDLLMQIVFHSTIAEATGAFTLDDVVEAVNRKLLRRHPHVFAGEKARDADAVWARWDEIKAQERAAGGGDGSPASALASLPRALPALQRAQTLAGRAARAGLGPPEPAPLDALDAALRALREADPSGGRRAGRLGALLWAAVRYARAHGIDAESALRERTQRFAEAAGAPSGGQPARREPRRVSSGPARGAARPSAEPQEEP